MELLNLSQAKSVHENNISLQMRSSGLSNFFANDPVFRIRQPSSLVVVFVVVVECKDPVASSGALFRL